MILQNSYEQKPTNNKKIKIEFNNNIFVLHDDILSHINLYANINSLLNCCSSQYESKKKLHYWKINKKYSRDYYSDNNFRNKFLLSLKNPLVQLSLDLSNFHLVEDIVVLENIHSLDLSNCHRLMGNVEFLRRSHFLNLSGCYNISDASLLGKNH